MGDYDSPWKTVLERYFAEFLAFFFPEAHAGIDWTQSYALLDKELQKFDEEKRMRYVSSLERIAQKKGMEKGMEKRIGQGQARLLRALIQQRFGLIPPDIAARIKAGVPEQSERWALRVLDAAPLEDMFRSENEHRSA
jgi:hypothetical protein